VSFGVIIVSEFTTIGYNILVPVVAILSTIAIVMLVKMQNRLKTLEGYKLKLDDRIPVIATLIIVIVAYLQTFFGFIFPSHRITSFLLSMGVGAYPLGFLALLSLDCIAPIKKLMDAEKHVKCYLYYGIFVKSVFTVGVIGAIQLPLMTTFMVIILGITWIFGVIILPKGSISKIKDYLEVRAQIS